MDKITPEEAVSIFSYDPDTGDIIRSGSETPAGSINGSGYRSIKVKGRWYQAHRLIWLIVHGVWPDGEIDHINGVRDDNRLENLRAVSRSENQRNTRIRSHNNSGIQGIGWHKRDKKWQVRIFSAGKNINIGLFDSIGDAAAARRAAEVEYGYHYNHGRRC